MPDPREKRIPRRETLKELVALAGMTPVGALVIRSVPPGLSGWQCMVESHACFHTWPEDRAVRIEISSCRAFNSEHMASWLSERFQTGRITCKVMGGAQGLFSDRLRGE